MTRSLQDAQHEAAHVVVGVALGLRLLRATLGARVVRGEAESGSTEWVYPWPKEAGLIMTAAGVAWERRRGDLEHAGWDLRDLRRAGVRGQARLVALERAAWAVLMSRPGAFARVTRLLAERDITARDVRFMARGERPPDLF